MLFTVWTHLLDTIQCTVWTIFNNCMGVFRVPESLDRVRFISVVEGWWWGRVRHSHSESGHARAHCPARFIYFAVRYNGTNCSGMLYATDLTPTANPIPNSSPGVAGCGMVPARSACDLGGVSSIIFPHARTRLIFLAFGDFSAKKPFCLAPKWSKNGPTVAIIALKSAKKIVWVPKEIPINPEKWTKRPPQCKNENTTNGGKKWLTLAIIRQKIGKKCIKNWFSLQQLPWKDQFLHKNALKYTFCLRQRKKYKIKEKSRPRRDRLKPPMVGGGGTI